MRFEDPDVVRDALNEVPKISIRERALALLELSSAITSDLNCIGTALFVLGRIKKPAAIDPIDYSVMESYLADAELVNDGKECGDMVLFDYENPIVHIITHAAVFLGPYKGKNIVFQKFPLSNYSIQDFEDLDWEYRRTVKVAPVGLKVYRFA
ncbi:MAG: hypothetical protein J4452_01405 [Candidatus Aenigmarchaeota archaeon]|nr:hypothetical protein [Candidatus Aenigmarchaeota archaeon]